MRRFAWLLAAVIAVCALWSAGWFYAAGEAGKQIELLATNDGESAPQLRCGSFATTGFPFRFDFACTDAKLVSADETLTLKGLRASVLAYNPTHLIFSAAAPFTMANAFTGSQSRVDFTGLEGSLRLESADLIRGFAGEGWRIGRASVLADGVAWNDTLGADLLQASADHLEAHLLDIPEQHDKAVGKAALAVYAEVKNLSAPGFEIAAGDATLEAELSGLPDDLRAFADPEPLRRWQRAGGLLKLVRFAGNQAQPDNFFDVSGEASLTETGLLNADIRYRTKGVFERFAAFIPPLQMPLLQGKTEPDGSHTNAIRMQNGAIRLLTFTLVTVPTLFE